jgi:hypothetical protein
MSAPSEELQPCGTHASYRRHLRNGEETCPECRQAHAEYVATFRRGASYKRTSGREPRSVREVAA